MCVTISATGGALRRWSVGAKVNVRAGSHVVVPAGRGVLVRSLAETTEGGPLCLLTDAGQCFPIADAARWPAWVTRPRPSS